MSWRVYVRLGRVSNLPTVWTNVLAGVVLAGTPVDARTLLVLALACSLFYVGGMFLNDAFDREIDARERPERPIPSGLIGAREVFAIGFGMLGVALGLLVYAAAMAGREVSAAAGVGLGLAATVIYYDAHHKRNPLSPVVMGICRMLVYVLAAVVVAGTLPPPVLLGALTLFAYVIGLTYAAKQETLARIESAWPLACLAAPFLYALPALASGPVGAVVYIAFLAWVGFALRLLHHGGPSIPRAVVSLLAGISLLDAALIARAGRPGLAALAVMGFAATLVLQRWVRGT